MRIQRLHLVDFQQHLEATFDFAPGLTVVRGPNEAGKSTLQRAIEMALFRRATSGGAEMDALRPWGREGATPLVELDFEHDGAVGHLTKAFAGPKGTAHLTFGDEDLSDPVAVDRRLAELSGLPSEKFYRSTASVHHYGLQNLDPDEATLRDRLQSSMSGADRGTSAARKKLEDALRRLTTEGPRNPGTLKQDRDRVAELTAAAQQGEAGLAALARDQATLSEARDGHGAAQARVTAARELLERAEHAVGLLERQHDAATRYERYKRAAELRDDIAAREVAHPSALPLPSLRGATERLRQQAATVSALNAELADTPDVSRYDVGSLPSAGWRRFALGGIVLVLIGAVVALGTIAIPPLGAASSIAGIIIAAVGLVLAVMAVLQQRRASDVKRQNVLRENEISRRLRGRSDIEQQLKDTIAARDAGLAALDLPDVPAVEQLLAAETAHQAAIDQLHAEYRGLLGAEQPTDDVARLRDAAAAEGETARHALAGMGDVGSDPIGTRDRAKASLASGEAERERTMAVQADARAKVEQNPTDAEEVAAVSEALATAQERLDLDERRQRVYRMTLDTLDRAEQATMKRAARFLEARMGTDVTRITDGRYRRVQVDEAELTLSVWSPERGDWIDARSLSQGTIDALYLAARLGLVRQVTQDRRPPLIFDDPFLTFDAARAQQALELLRGMAVDHQVIYLTASDRYDGIAERVIELAGPTGRDAGDPDHPA